MSVLALLYAIAMLQQVLWVAVAFPISRALGTQIAAVNLGSPGLIKFKVRGTPVAIGPFPAANMDMPAEGPLGRRIAVRLLPWVVIFGVAVALLGPSHALRSFAHAYGQLLLPADPKLLVEHFLVLARDAAAATTFGVVTAKLVAFNLLPLAGLSGGGVILDMFTARRKEPSKLWLVGSLLIMLVVVARFVWALAQVL